MDENNFRVSGELIKMIHNELPAVRWTCGNCGEDACTIFYEPEEAEKFVQCETCEAGNFVQMQEGSE